MAYDNSDKPGSNEPDRNPDPITGAPGSHPLGTGIGTGSGALTGAALGAIGGPVGAAIGIIAGGIVGAIAGHKAGEYNDPTEDFSKAGQKHADPVAAATNPSGGSVDADYWRASHATRPYASADDDYDSDFAPAYGYGTEVGRQHQLAGGAGGNSIDEMDADLRGGWDQVRGRSKLSYDQARPAIADAFDRHFADKRADTDAVPTGEVRLDEQKISGTRSAVDNVTRGAVTGGPRTTEEAGSGNR